ncbi:MAG: alpha/beta hydrolase [Clostridiales bacterium]|nr:alpha/beta hydrolase [Clostridiales bacterium]
MKPEEITFTGSDGATTLYASVWEPEGECRGTVQICHGMSEHIGRYHWLAEQLTARGYRVCGDDHLGHGRTAQRKEDLGYFGAKDGWKHLIEDEHLLFGIMRQRAPEQPYFLLGHSMGSFITRAYITRFGEGLSGYICCGTSGRNPLVKPARFMAAVVSVFSGPKKTGKFLDRMAFKDYNSRYENAVTGHEWLSRDQAVYAEFAGDPKSGFIFKNAGFRDLFHLLDSVTGRKWSDRIPKDLPILLLSGDADPVGQYGEGVKEVYGWIQASGVKDVKLKLYPDARHELHNELCREEFVGDVVAFLEAHR